MFFLQTEIRYWKCQACAVQDDLQRHLLPSIEIWKRWTFCDHTCATALESALLISMGLNSPSIPRSSIHCNLRPCLFYLLDYGIAALQKPKSEEKNKSSAPAFFSRLWFVSPIKKKFRRPYRPCLQVCNSAHCCFATGNVVLRSPGI
jgi:hypothetical protein